MFQSDSNGRRIYTGPKYIWSADTGISSIKRIDTGISRIKGINYGSSIIKKNIYKKIASNIWYKYGININLYHTKKIPYPYALSENFIIRHYLFPIIKKHIVIFYKSYRKLKDLLKSDYIKK